MLSYRVTISWQEYCITYHTSASKNKPRYYTFKKEFVVFVSITFEKYVFPFPNSVEEKCGQRKVEHGHNQILARDQGRGVGPGRQLHKELKGRAQDTEEACKRKMLYT